ncbi:MAG TPA: amidohydrolase family protein [Bryobacteraceae bacterium]|nr:amidohydrolase family protein [Bryobacteraceae bacterium]
MTRIKCSGRDAISGDRITIEFDDVIQNLDPAFSDVPDDVYIAPGFIDIQVNGFAGVDYNAPDAPVEDIARSLRVMFSTGVSRCFPTVITGDPERMLGALRNLAAAREALPEGSAMEAFHVEGPHISPEDGPRGAHPERWVRPPDVDEYKRWQEAANGNVRLVTLSPEWPEAARYIDMLSRDGVVASIGHTKATAAQIQDAVSAGATLSTHIGNGAHAVMSRHPNYIWEQLAEDRLNASMIVDGIHIGPAFLKVALRAKGVERSVLITDAVMPAMCKPGRYLLGEVEVELHADHSVRMFGGTRLAGSSLRMDKGVENLMKIAGLTLAEAITMATTNAARAGRLGGRIRGLQPGSRADVVKFRLADGKLEVLETYVSGSRVF